MEPMGKCENLIIPAPKLALTTSLDSDLVEAILVAAGALLFEVHLPLASPLSSQGHHDLLMICYPQLCFFELFGS